MKALRNVNLGLMFVLELSMIVAFGYWGFHAVRSRPVAVLLGIGLPLAAALLWGLFMSPRARIPLAPLLHRVVTALFFVLAAASLVAAGQPVLGGVLVGLFVVNRVTDRFVSPGPKRTQ